MNITTYGYRNPDVGDLSKGSTGWMASYNFNVTRLDSHNHDGINSAAITIQAFAAVTQTLSAANWVSAAPATGYKQTATVPLVITDIENNLVKFTIKSGANINQIAYLTFLRVTATTYTVYSNDNTIDVLVSFR